MGESYSILISNITECEAANVVERQPKQKVL